MNLTPEQREQVRLSLLRYGLRYFSLVLARSYLIAEGFARIEPETVQAEARYLMDKGLLISRGKKISPENHVYETTAEGRDYLAEAGIV